MKKTYKITFLFILFIFAISAYSAKLAVKLTPQEEQMWCWAATSECAIEYYGGDITQSYILQQIYGKIDPNQAGQPDDMVRALNLFDCNAQAYTNYNLPSSESELKAAADAKHPSTLGHNRQHVITYCGYTENGSSTVYHIMDPWPVDVGEWADYTHAQVLNNHLGALDLVVTTNREIEGNDEIIITKPEAGEELEKSVPYSIRWTDGPDGNVKIELKKGTSIEETIASSTTNSGSYSWTPGENLAVGSNYKIVISDISNSSNSAESGTFSIIENTSIKYNLEVVDGSGSGEYPAGATIEIQAEAPSSDKIFSKWTSNNTNAIEDVNSAKTSITMPANDYSVTATFTDRPEGSENLVVLNLWESTTDDLSECTLDSSKVKSDTLLKADLKVGKKDDDKGVYPYSEFATYLEGDYSNMIQIEVTYKSDKKVWLVLPQEGLADSGASHQAEVAPSTNWKTEYFDVSKPTFNQPSWVSGSLAKDLDKSKIQGVAFMADGYDQSTNLQLKSVYLYGFIGSTPITNNNQLQQKSFAINSVNKRGLKFNISKEGKYDISIYSANGKNIKVISKNFSAGKHSIDFDNKLISNQVVFIKVESLKEKAVIRSIIR